MGFWLLQVSNILYFLFHQNLRFAPFREGANKTKVLRFNIVSPFQGFSIFDCFISINMSSLWDFGFCLCQISCTPYPIKIFVLLPLGKGQTKRRFLKEIRTTHHCIIQMLQFVMQKSFALSSHCIALQDYLCRNNTGTQHAKKDNSRQLEDEW